MKKIAVTGTKGKTTVSNVLAEVLHTHESRVLHVNTNGAYVNGKQKISKAQSQQIWDVVPTVAPGRFLYLIADKVPNGLHPDLPGVAVLEASLGCGTPSGLGYYGHDIGIFTNVYEDHLGSRDDLTSRHDIGRSKSFIFSRINRGGHAVFNADDDVVTKYTGLCKEDVTLVPFGRDFKFFDLQTHINENGKAVGIDGNDIVLLSKGGATKILDYSKISWTFEGAYEPSVMNLLAIVAALLVYFEYKIPESVLNALLHSKMSADSGRLTLLQGKNGVKILADYAHEKQSLQQVAKLAHKLKKSSNNKVIGVVRLSWDREEALITDTANSIANQYDSFVVYDKIDGHFRQPSSRMRANTKFKQEVGKISGLFADALKNNEVPVKRILREDKALEYVSTIVSPGDVVVFIVNDDITQSIDFVKKYFEAHVA